MKNPGSSPPSSGRNRLLKLLTTEFHDAQQPYALFTEFLGQKHYSQSFCRKLLAVARARPGEEWDVRRLAVLMLEHQVLKLDPNNPDDFEDLLVELNLKSRAGRAEPIVSSVLREGYTTIAPTGFIPELLRRLRRLSSVHAAIKGGRTSAAALRDFIEQSRRDCKLTLARYLFTPEEVADQILSQVQVTEGVKDLDPSQPKFLAAELEHAFSRLPDFEAGILKRFCQSSDIYWAAETTSSEITSLVESPLTTVVLVIKPPGSDIEFEIKRAGRKREHSLNVVFARNGYTVPPSHRLDGGSMQWLLRFEAMAGSRFALIYRLAHKTEAPMPSYISRSTINTLPVDGEPVQTLLYFTEPHLFGKGFREMRTAMRESVSAFNEEGSANLPGLPGDLGLTAQFISQVAPAQAILCGTSSFRLDRLARYLSPDGPEQYFEALGISPTPADSRRLVDALLEETLGVYVPPNVRYQNLKQYLKSAFVVAENRARADRIYLSLVRQIGNFWGTLLAVRGYSRGESFVGRNVGLKSCWEAGEWQVKIVFMDHDALVIPGRDDKNFLARNALPEMKLDERYIWGGSTPAQFSTSEVGYLKAIYCAGDELLRDGQTLALQALKESYRKTQQEVLTNPILQPLFNKQFLARLPDWDQFVGGYLQLNGNKATTTRWKKKMKKTLVAKGYRAEAFDTYADSIERNRSFLECYRQLFEIETEGDYNEK